MAQQDLAGYQAALNGAAFFAQTEAGYLRIAGPDRRAFIQRQSTNEINQLSGEQLLVSVLTSPNARILDVLLLFEDSPETLAALTLPRLAARTDRYLRSRIFFMDKVSVVDASQEFAQFDLIGPQASGLLKRPGLSEPAFPRPQAEADPAGNRYWLFPQRGFGHRLVVETRGALQFIARLEEAGFKPLSVESYDILRVEAGLPAAGNELSEEFTPLETGLEWAVSGTKGCYTGQEVIARQITYDKVTQHLVGLRLAAPASPGTRLFETGEGRPVGRITSAVPSPRFGPIAIAVVHRPFDSTGTRLSLGSDPDSPTAVVTALPFSPVQS